MKLMACFSLLLLPNFALANFPSDGLPGFPTPQAVVKNEKNAIRQSPAVQAYLRALGARSITAINYRVPGGMPHYVVQTGNGCVFSAKVNYRTIDGIYRISSVTVSRNAVCR